jgi:hypothetical protein
MGFEIRNLYRASYLEKPQNKSRVETARRVAEVFWAIKATLILRIFFISIDILPSGMERSFESLSYPLVAPFYAFLGSKPPTSGLELASVFAFIMYAIIGFLAVQAMRSNIVSSPAEEY